jgi:hypothetical protein
VGCNIHVHGSNAKISLYSNLYLKLAKTLLFIISYVFSSTKSENNRFCLEVEGGVCGEEVAQTMHTHVS